MEGSPQKCAEPYSFKTLGETSRVLLNWFPQQYNKGSTGPLARGDRVLLSNSAAASLGGGRQSALYLDLY